MLLSVTVTQGTARCYIDPCDCCSTLTSMFLPAGGPGRKDGAQSWVSLDKMGQDWQILLLWEMYVVSQSLHCLGHMTFLSVLCEIWQIYLFVSFYSISSLSHISVLAMQLPPVSRCSRHCINVSVCLICFSPAVLTPYYSLFNAPLKPSSIFSNVWLKTSTRAHTRGHDSCL